MWTLKTKKMNPVLVGHSKGVPWHSCQLTSLPDIYVQNASLEIAKSNVIFKNNSISGNNIAPLITNKCEGYDINNEKDWIYAEYLCKNNQILPKINLNKIC